MDPTLEDGRAREARLWPLLCLVVLIALLAFVLSFDALRQLGVAVGVQPALSWMFPLIVDLPVVAFTWATWVFKTRGIGQRYPWAMLCVFSLVSLAGNALHARPVPVDGVLLPRWLAAGLMAMPPVALLATSHMIVMAAARSLDARVERLEAMERAGAVPAPVVPVEDPPVPEASPAARPEAMAGPAPVESAASREEGSMPMGKTEEAGAPVGTRAPESAGPVGEPPVPAPVPVPAADVPMVPESVAASSGLPAVAPSMGETRTVADPASSPSVPVPVAGHAPAVVPPVGDAFPVVPSEDPVEEPAPAVSSSMVETARIPASVPAPASAAVPSAPLPLDGDGLSDAWRERMSSSLERLLA